MSKIQMVLAVFAATLIVALSAGGCTKFIDFEGEGRPSRLVVNGLMQADSVFTVELSNSLGYIDTGQIQLLENGLVAVHDEDGNIVDSLQYQGEGRYRSTAVAQSGERYTIRAIAGSFPEAHASDLVPEAIPIFSWDTLTVPGPGSEFGEQSLNIFFNIQDPSTQENFYLLELYSVQDYVINPIFDLDGTFLGYDTIYIDDPSSFQYCLVTSDPVLMSENDVFAGEVSLFSCSLLFSDRLFNGQNRQFAVRIESFFAASSMELRLTSLSPDYYRYSRTLQRYDYVEGDPFAEPVQVFSNMQGNALGIWGGASISVVKIQF
jgi:hypothetical protein